MTSNFLTTKEAADYINVNWQSLKQSRIRLYLKGKKAPKYIKESNKIFYKQNDLDEWLSYSVVNPRKPPFWEYNYANNKSCKDSFTKTIKTRY